VTMSARTSRPKVAAPSFRGFTPASEASSYAKRHNPSTNTKPEVILCRALFERGLRYRKNVGAVAGKPDIVFSRARVAIFCDGDFWHGRDWTHLKRQLEHRANAAYWIPKIAANRARDVQTRRALRRVGWLVIRVWETDVRENPRNIAAAINKAIAQRLRLPRPRGSPTAAPKMLPSAKRTEMSSGSV